MLNVPMLKKEARSTWFLFLLLLGILTMYVTVVLSMFDPALSSIFADFEDAMPGLMSALGMSGAGNADMIHYTASYLFGFIMLLFPVLYSIIVSNRMVAKYVDSGSMAYLLATPNTRTKIIVTQGLFLWVSVMLLVIISAAIGGVYSEAAFPGEMDMGKYVLLNVGVLGLHTAISGVGFFASCIFNETKYSYAVGAGVPIACFVLQIISNLGGRYENLKYATFFTLFSPEKLLAGETMGYVMVGILYAAGAVLYIAGGIIFTKRNLPL